MPTFKLPDFSSAEGVTLEKLIDEIAKMRKELTWLLYHQDHVNVKRLETEYCDIRSHDGETVIDGPKLLMYDRQATPQLRLRAGYDEVTGDFLFELYNKAGVKTVGIDSNGDATFTGSITSSTITGGTIRTAATGGRIELTESGLTQYDSIYGYRRVQIGIPGSDAGRISFYRDTVEIGVIAQESDGFLIFPTAGNVLILGATDRYTVAKGDWSFASADSITGLKTSTGTTGPGGADSHTHSIPQLSVVIG